MATHAVSVRLLKDSISSGDEALKQPDGLERAQWGDDPGATLYWKRPFHRVPRWAGLFSDVVGDALADVKAGSASAVMTIQVEGRWFALTFGFGHSLLKPDSFEENFGLRVVLNAVNPERLRSIDAQSLETVTLSRRHQSGRAADLGAFGIDVERDVLFAASGEPDASGLGRQLTGKDALRLSLPIALSEIPPLLARLLALSESKDYQSRGFSWVDNLGEVRDPALKAMLDAALEAKVSKEDFTRTWLAAPDIIEWADVEGFKYNKPVRGTLHDDIRWESYLDEIGAAPTIAGLKSGTVYCISASSGERLHEWPVYRCVYCELDLDGHAYVLNNGRWYRVDEEFLEELSRELSTIPQCELNLPAYDAVADEDEEAYNRRVSEADPAFLAFLDGQTIWYGGGRSQIEFCDLFTRERHMVHVKRYGGSSVLSHLFSQGVVSAEVLMRSADFRERLNEKLPDSHRLPDPTARPDTSAFEVVYGIITRSKSEAVDLPLFSRITLRNARNRLASLDLPLSMAFIRMAEPASEDEG